MGVGGWVEEGVAVGWVDVEGALHIGGNGSGNHGLVILGVGQGVEAAPPDGVYKVGAELGVGR